MADQSNDALLTELQRTNTLLKWVIGMLGLIAVVIFLTVGKL
jgi:hypothetical protein